MKRTDIHLTSSQVQGLEHVDRETGRLESDIIREGVDQYLTRLKSHERLTMLRVARGIWQNREINIGDLRDASDGF